MTESTKYPHLTSDECAEYRALQEKMQQPGATFAQREAARFVWLYATRQDVDPELMQKYTQFPTEPITLAAMKRLHRQVHLVVPILRGKSILS